ncbi:Der GTPase-activating protein YihI [Colwellia sp. 20A7]|jgi:ribosome assembly protein YihI (activator of Der GTPase)|uniref:Der GTPase-activating protein YihI n=1 Tax=Colwellia sp. 20A7 TaxID=2689569 RepID=UPI00135C0E5E|nr:Der GTPase-activating protein YihI [Colwellia sp. 20A7]
MSRTKKSRKPGGAPTAKAKLSKVELSNIEKRVRKKTGNKPGNRQQEAQLDNNSVQNGNLNKDPRIGSKKAIDLGGSAKPAQNKPVEPKAKIIKPKQDPIAALRSVADDNTDVELSLAQELANIEEDEQLQVILTKQEDGIDLTHEEVDYFNSMMERHEEISAELDDEEDEIINTSISSEEDLWDKLDNSSLPDSTK